MIVDKETIKSAANSLKDMGMIKDIVFVTVGDNRTLSIVLDDAFGTVFTINSKSPLDIDVSFDATETKKIRKSVFDN